ncbi:EAL domain-containing protein [Citromicrobium bathyomarinum]|uniref:putative bifunctional diguanylate cyclase/phosphodiesterase n=1 Tax=Citromicrobium bathyomarinum TaxID=72174 RepID=UPI003159AFF9
MSKPNPVEVERGLLSIAYGNLPTLLVMSVVASLGASVVLSGAGYTWIWFWFVGVVFLNLVRFALSRGVSDAKIQRAEMATVGYYRRTYAIGLYASAALWLAPISLVGHDSVASIYTLAIIFSALAAGGTGIMAALLREGRTYIAIMLGPASILMFRGFEDGTVLMALGLVFLAVMLVVHDRNHKVTRRALELSVENRRLVEELQSVNAGLEDTVARRTRQLANAANSDDLTGLANRRGLIEWMKRNLDPDDPREASALFLDLDRFKHINDAMGHSVGDQVLKVASQRMTACVPEGAVLARWGGDEFVMVLPQNANVRATARDVATRLIEGISRPFLIDDHAMSIGLSVGVSFYPTDASDHRALILAADLAMAEVKRNGRGASLEYSETLSLVQRRRFDLGRALGAAIENGDLFLEYQPIVDSSTGRIHAFEALARWQHPTLGKINPAEFIELAETTDRINALGDLVLEKACFEAATWPCSDHAPKVAVNVSVKQLRDDTFALKVMRILARAKLPPGRLEIEVTESLFENDHPAIIKQTISSLRALGVFIAIDDFGTGYSSLSRLQNLPVNAVKIDQSFVADLDGNGRAVIESIIMIANRLELDVVAEGVETDAQLDTLIGMGVNCLQGYLLGHPSRRADSYFERKRSDWTAGDFARRSGRSVHRISKPTGVSEFEAARQPVSGR